MKLFKKNKTQKVSVKRTCKKHDEVQGLKLVMNGKELFNVCSECFGEFIKNNVTHF